MARRNHNATTPTTRTEGAEVSSAPGGPSAEAGPEAGLPQIADLIEGGAALEDAEADVAEVAAAAPAASPAAAPVAARAGIHDERIAVIRARLEAIGDPFGTRQALANIRAGLLEERRKKDEDLRLKIAHAETELEKEQQRAQWVAQEKHDLEKELAKLLK